jgi:hypothetical protein
MEVNEFFKPSNIRNYVQGNIKYLKYKLGSNLPKHEIEQALWRAHQCHLCLLEGKCRGCGCKTPELFFAPNKKDHDEKWGKMLSPEKWEQFKKDNGIEVPTEEILNEALNFTRLDKKDFIFKGDNAFGFMSIPFLLKLDDALVDYGGPFKLIHSYLDKEYNDLKGEKNKMHIAGRAVDIEIFNSQDAARFLKCMLVHGFTVGLSGRMFHVDNRNPQIFYQI